MNSFSIKFNDYGYSLLHLEDYLKQLNGVCLVLVDINKDSVYVEYDKNVISLDILKKEMFLVLNRATILSFDKHISSNVCKDTIVVESLCCEYCFFDMMEKLFVTNGIVSAYSDYDFCNYRNVKIFITYDSSVMGKGEIEELKCDIVK